MKEIIELPGWIEDISQKLPWNKNYKGGWPKRRVLEDIEGVCFHQTWGNTDPVKVNNYHINPNHISKKGCPHICYTIFIDGDGKVTLCNDWKDVTWSQGTSKTPGDENKLYLSVCVGGKFKNKHFKKYPDPSVAQMEAADKVWRWLKKTFRFSNKQIYGHFDFGKATCPGDAIEEYIRKTRKNI